MSATATNTTLRCSSRPYEAACGTIPGVYVAMSKFVNNTAGAVSMCAHEYLRTIAATGFALELVTFDVDRRPRVRLKRKLWPRPYCDQIPPFVVADVAAVVRKTGARFVFLYDAAPLAAALRAELGNNVQIVMLSLGMESVDYLHKLRSRDEIGEFFCTPHTRRAMLADQLFAESAQRQCMDHVFCLAPFEAEIERWLGARAVTWLPRVVSGPPLSWGPQGNRIGFVGSLSHEPNLEGLLQFVKALEPLAPKELSLRVVGGPEKIGRDLARRFRFIEYLGPLSDPELEAEAATWNCFLNPLFCFARGCSTKLAVALGWHIPVLTTPSGCRGYTWSAGELPVADTPEAFARLAIAMMDRETAENARREIQLVAGSSPTVNDVAAKIRAALLGNQHA